MIADRKVGAYLLNEEHPEGGDKARFYLAHGFSMRDPGSFVAALLAHGGTGRLAGATETMFGRKYVYEGPMRMPDGSTWRVRSVWHRAPNSPHRMLVTAYPF